MLSSLYSNHRKLHSIAQCLVKQTYHRVAVHNLVSLSPMGGVNKFSMLPSSQVAASFKLNATLAGTRAFSAQSDSGGIENIDEYLRTLDTSLTDEQKAYVASIKHKIKGGPKSPRSLYRDVPMPHEIRGVGNLLPKIPENAEALIDYALSHIPRRAGPRRSRRKKRMEARHEQRRENHRRRKEGERRSYERKLAKRARIRQEVKDMYAEAARINQIRQQQRQQFLQLTATNNEGMSSDLKSP